MHVLQMIHIAHDMIDMGQRQQLVTFLGQIMGHMHLLYMIHIAHDMIDMILSRTTVGHIFGANFKHMNLLHMILHRKDRPETKTHNSWSHFWGKLRHLLYMISIAHD